MRFGISPLSLGLILDKVLKEKGLNGLSQFRLSELVEGVAKAGYKHCEISLDIFQIFPIQVTDEEIQRLKKIKQDYDISFSAHFPFISIELASPNKFIREASIRSIIDAYESFIQLKDDIDVYVLHPTGEFMAGAMKYISDPGIYPIAIKIFTESAIQSIKAIIDKSGIDRNKIAIENVEFPLDATIKIVKKLDTKLCIDTAHLLAGFSGKHDLIEITEKYFDIMGEIHLQDYDDDNLISDHCALGTGKNFPPDFLNLVHQKDFKGPIVFELPREDIMTSIEYIKKNAPRIEIPNIRNQPFY